MKGGRKNLKRATDHETLTLQDGESIVQVVSLRGSNLIEVMDAKGDKSLALFPAKFQKTVWMKRGSFVVVDASGKEKALESGSKIACIVSRYLSYGQVRTLQKSPQWPDTFRSTLSDDSSVSTQRNELEEAKDLDQSSEVSNDDDDDDGLPPLEANVNRVKPPWLQEAAESESGSDTDP